MSDTRGRTGQAAGCRNLSERIRGLSPRQKAALGVGYAGFLVLLMLAAAETALRLNGVIPWNPAEAKLLVTPGNSFVRKDSLLGYANLPGRFTFTLEDGYSFQATHLSSSLRATHPPERGGNPATQGEIWIFGCSFTYGWSLNDAETYPWVLQERFPEYEVLNFGVVGYGTVQSLLQFREELKRTRPRVAVLAYAGFHDPRNTALRGRRKQVGPFNKLGPLLQPYARLDEGGALRYGWAEAEYRELPLQRRLALVNFADELYNRQEDRVYRSREVSKTLIKEMQRLAREHGVPLVLAVIAGGREILEFSRANGIPSVDLAVDLELPENRNLPHDAHPSAAANRQYAEELETFLRREILQGAAAGISAAGSPVRLR